MQSNQQDSMTNQIHLIDENSNLRSGLVDFLKKNNFEQFGKNYNIIAIIGSQSTGKSTLLNKLFGTQFKELNTKEQRNQTTKGVWLSKDCQNPLLILDVEGSDSTVRWDEHFFEQSTALLALAISQVLIINIWTSDVGRFSGSQYGILKIILEMNIKLFGQDSTKQIIFVLRDYSPEENYVEITKLILGDINKIWNEIKKPNELQNKQVEYFFKIDFFTLNHLKYAKEEFETGVKILRSQFTNQNDENYLFKYFQYNTNLPINALNSYIVNIWETIKTNKDLNLPSQKIMVANMRCDQIIQETFELVKVPFQNLKKNAKISGFNFFLSQQQNIDQIIDKDISSNFGQEGFQIIEQCQQYFDKNASDYISAVYEEKREQLLSQLLSELFNLFQLQIKKIKQKLMNDFLANLTTLQKQKIMLPQKVSEIKIIVDKIFKQFDELCKSSQVLPQKPWDITQDYQDFYDSLMQNSQTYQDKIINEYLVDKERNVKRELEKIINICFENLDLKEFWNQIQNVYNQQINQAQSEIIQNFQCLNYNANAQFKQLQTFQEEIFKQLVLELKKKSETSTLIFYLLKWFRSKFERNDRGLPKDWRKMMKEQIETQFFECRTQLFDILNIFKYIQVVPNQEQTPMQETFYETLIDDLQFQQLKNKLQDEVDYILADALAKHESKPSAGIPKWMWAILIFFMYDDVLRWMSNWYMLYPLLLTFCFIGFSFAIGQGKLPLVLLKEIIKVLKSLFGEHVTKAALKLGLG